MDSDIYWTNEVGNTMLNLADDESIEINVRGKKMIIINNSRFKSLKKKEDMEK